MTRRSLAVVVALLVLAACQSRREAPARPAPRAVLKASAPDLLPVDPPPLDGLFDQAREVIRKRETELERRIADRRVSQADLAAAYGGLGQAYQAFGLFEPAVPCYENATRLDPRIFAWPYLLARVQRQLNHMDLAVAALEKALALEPTNEAARVFLGDVHRTAGRLEEARAAYERVIERSPGNAAAWAGLGQASFIAGDYPQAIASLERALRAQPQAKRIHYTLGLAYQRVGQRKKAEEHLAQRGDVDAAVDDPVMERMLQINPYNLAQRGVEALKAGKLGPAVALLRAASEAFPDNVEIRLQLAAAISYTGAHGEALVHYREALRLQPQNPDVHYNLGTTLWMLGRNEEALVHLRRAVELNPEYAEARFNLAQTLRRLGRDMEALAALDEVLRLAPTDIRALLARPRVLAQLGRCDEAVASARSALESHPGNIPLTDLLARALAACPEGQGRDPRAALRLAREVFGAAPSAEHAATVALAEGAGGGWAQAAAWQRRALDLLPAATSPAGRQAVEEQLRSYQQRTLPSDW